MIRLVYLALALLALGARPARGDDAPAGVLTRAPAVVAPVEPEYPAEARAAGLEGAVTLELELSDAGDVTDAVVTGPAGHGFDEAALAAARRLRFSPAELDGKPAAVRIEYRFTFALATLPAAPPAPAPNLRGQVLERGTRLPVAGARVSAGDAGTYTDREGRFELAVAPDGEVEVVVEEPEHGRLAAVEAVRRGEATEVRYFLERTAQGAFEAVVTGAREQREVSHVAVSAGEIRRVPGVSGDAVKVIQNLPGVARTPGVSGDLVVRGGNPRDTRVYVDGHEVPQVFHFGGLTSVYSSELVKDVEFEAGNFGVRYGRAIGGRVNLVTRDPGDRTHALADANLYHATALVEGRPREDVGVALAARRSYADAVLTRAADGMKDGPSMTVAPRYYDAQAKVAWKATPDDTVRLDVFGSDDRMVLAGFTSDDLLEKLDVLENGTRFWAASLRWDHRASDATRVKLEAGGGWAAYTTTIGDLFSEDDRVWTGTLRAEVHHQLAARVKIVAGVDGLWYPRAAIAVTAPEIPPAGQIPAPEPVERRYDATLTGGEGGAFVEATLEPVDGLFVVPGIRADVHRSLATLAWVDPRLAVRWEARPGTALKAAAGLYHHAPALVYLTDEWGNPELGAEAAWQYSGGAEQRLGERLSLDVQLYWKRLVDLTLPTDATVVRGGREVPLRYESAGTGDAYGAELLLRWNPDGRFFGWIAYSLSRARRDQAVAGGRVTTEGDAYDQPHNLVAVGTWELPELWRGLSAGFRLRYTTGSPYEAVRTAVYDADGDLYRPIETGRRSARMPDFLQLDVRVDKRWAYRTWSLSAYLELQNALDRANAEAVAYGFDYRERGWMTGLPVFPAFGVRAEY
jgi:TonB family protein